MNLSRISLYNVFSEYLKSLTDIEVIQILTSGQRVNSTWGTALNVTINHTQLFIKIIPITTLENKPENYRHTANLFELPTCYQYGIGSAGFSVWRELWAHITTTEWVISEKCHNFPILYHWRVLPNYHEFFNLKIEDKKIIKRGMNKNANFWGGLQSVRTRLKALQQTPAHLVLFLEYIPYTVTKLLEQKLSLGDEKALIMIEKDLLRTIEFMNNNGMIHFDIHGDNMLTDGHHLYLTDFGLVMSSEFFLSDLELNFFHKHLHYDRYWAITNLIACTITTLYGNSNYNKKKHYLVSKSSNKISQIIINKYLSIAIKMEKFYRNLKKDKNTLYPQNQLNEIWNRFASKFIE